MKKLETQLKNNPINQNYGIQRVSNINEYIEITNEKIYLSPIDEFYNERTKLLNIVSDPVKFNSLEGIGNLIFIGIISITENYFRSVISEILTFCPISRSVSSNQNLSLGSVLWHDGNNVLKGSFENLSFADSDTIIKTIKKYLDLDIAKKGDTYAALEEYDIICQLRHAVVHSNSYVAGKNAIKVGFKSCGKSVSVRINYKQLQECAAVCTSLVSNSNVELFDELIIRWAVKWNKLPNWNPDDDYNQFKNIWSLFYSKIDESNNTITEKTTALKYKNHIEKKYNKV